jgi:hypothetical protein
MLCSSCIQIQVAILRRTGRRPVRGSWEWKHLEPLICTRCGAILPESKSSDPLLEKLGQLSRFGLTEGGDPILGLGPRPDGGVAEPCADDQTNSS